MANARFTVTRDREILGNFYSDVIGDLSLKEKRAICGILNLRLTGDMFFEAKTKGAVSDSFLPPSVNEDSGRKFWVYPPGKPLPA
jgi:hypothetical protein